MSIKCRSFIATATAGVVASLYACAAWAQVLAGDIGGPTWGGTPRPDTSGMSAPGSFADDTVAARRSHQAAIAEFGGLYPDKRLQAYVQSLGERIAKVSEYPALPWTFALVNQPSPNAYAVGGGYIYVTRGLLFVMNNEAELAGVLAHEIGHTIMRHGAKYSETLRRLGVTHKETERAATATPERRDAVLQAVRFSRDEEAEADRVGLRLMTKAGYQRESMWSFHEIMPEYGALERERRGQGTVSDTVEPFSYARTHPRDIDRIKMLARETEFTRQDNPRIGAEEYMAAIDGLAYGNDARGGQLNGGSYTHPGAMVAAEVPRRFEPTLNGPAVVARHQLGGKITISPITEVPAGLGMAKLLAEAYGSKHPLGPVDSRAINGMPAATATVENTDQDGVQITRFYALRSGSGAAVLVALSAPVEMVSEYRRDFDAVLAGIRPLSPTEAGDVKGHRIHVHRVKPGDSARALAARMPFGQHNAEMFRVLNNLEPGESLRTGQLVKVVR